MVIKIKTKVRTKIDLGSLHPGDCFKSADERALPDFVTTYWMVTDMREEKCEVDCVFCMNLKTGHLELMFPDKCVEPVKAEAIVEIVEDAT